MGLLEWYAVSVIVCFVMVNLASKLFDGCITVGSLLASMIIAAVPVVNFGAAVLYAAALLTSGTRIKGIMSKKLF